MAESLVVRVTAKSSVFSTIPSGVTVTETQWVLVPASKVCIVGVRAVKSTGAEEFEGFRDYQPGDPLRQLAWKNMAKGQGMLVKELSEPVSSSLWLNWELFYGLPVEEKLSRLSYLVLRLSQGSRPFGLKIPGVLIEPGIGPAHRSRLLRTLALFESAE